MKKFLLLVAAVVACALGMAAQQTLTIYEDGGSTSKYVPIYGFYCDDFLKCEFVVPATDLTAMKDNDIKQLTWYLSTAPTGNGWGNANFQIFMKEIDATTLTEFTGTEGATVVYEGPLDVVGKDELNIELTTPYAYGGGNLLIGVYNTVDGSYMSAEFKGKYVEGASVQGYNGSSLESVSATQRDFIPTTKFTYGDPLPYDAAVTPTALDFGKVYPGESKVLNVKVKNNGLNAFTPSLSVGAPFSAGEASEIASGAELEIPVTFAPTALGVYSRILTVSCGEAGDFTVDLTGICDDKRELVVCDGTSYSSYAPFYGTYYDTENTRTQMIYPAEMLTDIVGAEITGIKFHSRYNVTFNDGKLQVSVGNTESTAFVEGETGIEYPVTDLTPVASVTPATENYIWEIPFTEPYKYEGGNLAVETLVTEAATDYSSTTFYGMTTDYNSTFYEYVNYSGDHTAKGWNVLPKMTIVYKKAAEEPENPVFYVVGGFNGWSQQEGMVEIGEAGASITVEAQDLNNPNDKNQEFKIITPDVADGENWIWLGGADDNGVGYFGITDELLGGQISLETPGANFRLPEAGTYVIKLVKDETKAHVEGIKMVVTKETVTAIETINSDVKGDNNYYNLMGQKMNGNNLPAGIYIHNGKKIIVR